MTLSEIAHLRLLNQQLVHPNFNKPEEMVAHMGAMQAQDFAMSKWGLGIRLPGTKQTEIEEAFSQGKILRTHVLRPTWHLVTASDIYWMLELTAPHILSASASRQKQLELTEDILKKSNAIFEKALEGGKSLTRETLMKLLEEQQIATNENRSAHLMICAELVGLVCSGVPEGNKQTYALLEERVPKKNQLPREEALNRLAETYFTSHGPATLADFTWWSGLPVRDARAALESLKKELTSVTIDLETYWWKEISQPKRDESAFLLPAFDEYIISYKNRSASLAAMHHKTAISTNGIFYPVLLMNGQAAGLWKRTIKKEQVLIEASFFQSPGKKDKEAIEKAAEKFGMFLGKEVVVFTSSATAEDKGR